MTGNGPPAYTTPSLGQQMRPVTRTPPRIGTAVRRTAQSHSAASPVANASTTPSSLPTPYINAAHVEHKPAQAFSAMPTVTSPLESTWVQHPGLLKAVQSVKWVRPCQCGLLAYRFVHRFTTALQCTSQHCAQHGIQKDQSIYHCRNRTCFHRLCSQCFKQIPLASGLAKDSLLATFHPVPRDGHMQATDFLSMHAFPQTADIPDLGDMPAQFAHTLGNGATTGASSPSKLPKDLADQSGLSAYSRQCLGLQQLLPRVVTVSVLEYPPGGLGKRLGILFANAFWYMNESLSHGSCVAQYYILVFQFLPILVLYDCRKLGEQSGDQHAANRSIVLERIKLAEAGSWAPLVARLLETLQHLKLKTTRHDPQWEVKCERAVATSLSGNWHMAFRALGSSEVPPQCAETFDKVKSTFITDPLPDHPHSKLHALCLSTLAAPGTKAVADKLSLRMVDKRMRSLKSQAQPGSTRTRNTHLLLLLKSPWGLKVIQQWALLWLHGKIPPDVVALWTKGVVSPLSKKRGNGLRPITLFETAYKLPTGLALDVHRAGIVKAVGSFQYGALMASGADRYIYNVRSLASLCPRYAFVATDIKNAFGTVPRFHALTALLKHLPSLAPISANTWLPTHTTLISSNAPGAFGIFNSCEGVYQGECLSTAIFCIFLREVIDTFIANCAAAGVANAEKAIAVLAYVDDIVLAFDQSLFATVWPIYVSTLQKFNLLVETSKCKVWIPNGSTPLACITETLKLSPDALPVLGTAAGGSYATVITSVQTSSPLTVDADKRLSKAREDAALLCRLVDTPLSTHKRYAAWLMLCRSLAVRMDFDLRVLPPSVMAPLIKPFLELLQDTAKQILGLEGLSPTMLEQSMLSGNFGGLYMPSPDVKLQVAHLASLAASRKPTFSWLVARGFTPTAAFAAIDTSHARLALRQLAGRHIFATNTGEICTQFTPVPLLTFDIPLPVSITTLQGRLSRVLLHERAIAMSRGLDVDGRIRFLSSCGRGNGACYRDPSKKSSLHLDDLEFQVASALRLGHPLPAPPPCQNNSTAGRTCSRPLDNRHFLSCNIGGGVALLHRALSTAMVNVAKDCGASVKTEVPISEFVATSPSSDSPDADHFDPIEEQHAADAILDVVAYLPSGAEFIIDVSARNPLTNRYRSSACSKPGHAASRGEYDKRHRYKPSQGKHITPCVVDSFGRLGSDFLSFLDQAAALAMEANSTSSAQPRHIKTRWLVDISACIIKSVARRFRSSAYGSQGKRSSLESLFPGPSIDPQCETVAFHISSPTVSVQHNIRPSGMPMQMASDAFPFVPTQLPAHVPNAFSSFPSAVLPMLPSPTSLVPATPRAAARSVLQGVFGEASTPEAQNHSHLHDEPKGFLDQNDTVFVPCTTVPGTPPSSGTMHSPPTVHQRSCVPTACDTSASFVTHASPTILPSPPPCLGPSATRLFSSPSAAGPASPPAACTQETMSSATYTSPTILPSAQQHSALAPAIDESSSPYLGPSQVTGTAVTSQRSMSPFPTLMRVPQASRAVSHPECVTSSPENSPAAKRRGLSPHSLDDLPCDYSCDDDVPCLQVLLTLVTQSPLYTSPRIHLGLSHHALATSPPRRF